MYKGLLKRKSSRKLKFEIIIEQFTKRVPASGIVAVLLKTNFHEESEKKLVFEYFEKDELGK